MMKVFLSGNEAVALGAYESGVKVAAGYPGTPSTEILQNFSKYEGIYAEWAPNEKVAFEVCIGASMAGVRTMVTMKHVGLNVAADPFMTFSYTGGRGGFLLVSADDPGMHSSQNEQDNRYYAKFAHIPMLEPSTSQEAKDMVGIALEMSEDFDTPVMLRLTTRISHSKGIVALGKKGEVQSKGFQRDCQKYVMIPAYARLRHPIVLERLKALKEYSEKTPLQKIEWGDREIGIITAGVAYQYAKEVIPSASFFRVGMSYPLPERSLREFASRVKRLFVVEELEPFMEEEIRAMGLHVEGKEFFTPLGELSPEAVLEGLERAGVIKRPSTRSKEALTTKIQAPPRPPIMCPGCPHRGLFFALNRLNSIVTSDIGCYTLSVLPPLQSIDNTICMGASISSAMGIAKALEVSGEKDRRPVFATIGDSTFLHSGVTGLMDVAYNKGDVKVIILDNRTTAMTGGQDHPGTGRTLMGEETTKVDLMRLARALGIRRIRVVDPYDLKKTTEILKKEASTPGPSLIMTNRPCVLLEKFDESKVHVVDKEICRGCGTCLRLGCPSISPSEEIPSRGKVRRFKVSIDKATCRGCGLCKQVCTQGAISLRS